MRTNHLNNDSGYIQNGLGPNYGFVFCIHLRAKQLLSYGTIENDDETVLLRYEGLA